MKVILVTGGNRGIGLEVCRQLDQLGQQVILGTRHLEKGEKAAESMSRNVVAKKMDVTNEKTIHQVFEFVKNEYGRLDVLINNAGLGASEFNSRGRALLGIKNWAESNIAGVRQVTHSVAPLLRRTGILPQRKNVADIPIEEVKNIMETNLFGAWRTAQAFIPLLRRSKEGRIINISSGMGELKDMKGDYPGYRISKSSLNVLTIMLADELKKNRISVNAMCPGWVKTDMGGPNAPRTVTEGADTAVWLATEKDLPTGKFFRDRKEIEW